MDDNLRVEKWTLDDGRRAERRIINSGNEQVIELHVEEERPLHLQQRIVEKSKPIVYERRIETVDVKTGDVLEQRIESIEPRVQMQLVEHISAQNTVDAQSMEKDCDCHVTKEEMIDTIVAAFKANRDFGVKAQSVEFSNQLNSLGLADEINIQPASGMSLSDKLAIGVIVAQVIGLAYIIFFM